MRQAFPISALLLLTALASTAPSARAQVCIDPPDSTLVSWWPMDDDTGDVVDSNHPVNANAVSFEPGKVGSGMRLGAGGFINIPGAASLSLQNFTIEAWVRPDGPGATNDGLGSVIVAKYFADLETSAAVFWRATDNKFLFVFGNLATQRVVSANAFAPGQFYHVAARYNGTDFALFVNGVLQGQVSLVKTIPYSVAFPWVIGSNPPSLRGTSPRTWNGILDEIAIHNRALFVFEIVDHVNAGPAGMCKPHGLDPCPPPPAGQVSWWPFDGALGDAKDGNHPSASSGVAFVPGKVVDGLKLGTGGYVEIPDAANLANQKFTVSAWVRGDGAGPNDDPIGSVIVAKQRPRPAGDTDVPIMLSWSASSRRYLFVFGDTAAQRITSAQTYAPGQFHHVAGTYDGFAFRLWVDGTLQGLFSLKKTVVFDPATPWTIGASSAPFRAIGFPRTWNGVIDEVEVYDRALLPSELLTLFQAHQFGECKPFDITAPVVTILSPADGAVIETTSVLLTAQVADDTRTSVLSSPPGIDTLLPVGGGTVSGSVPLVEGPNLLSVSAEDAGGNVGGTSIKVILDTRDPAVLVLSPAEGAIVGDTPVAVRVRIADANGVTLEYGGLVHEFPDGFGTTTNDVDLVEGLNEIPIVATDVAGHSATVLLHLVLDTSSPLVTFQSPPDGAIFGPGESPIVVTATVDDVTGTVVASSPAGVSGTLPAGGGIVIGSVDLVEGANSIEVSALDEVGLSSSSSITVILDTTPPVVALVSPADGAPVRGTIDFHSTAVDVSPGTGIARLEFSVDGGLVASIASPPYESTLDTTAFPDGLHALAVVAVDGKENASTASIQVRVDNTPPAVAIVNPAAGAVVSGTIAFDASASDAGSGLASVQMLAAGSPPSVDASVVYGPAGTVASDVRMGSEDTSRHLDGPLTLQARVVDAAGNEAVTETTVTVDNTAPSKTLVFPTDGSVVSGIISIQALAEDPNLASIEIWVDGQRIASSATSPIVADFDTRTRLDGSMTVTVVTSDWAGNTSSCSATVVVNNLTFQLDPQTLNMKSKGGQNSVTAHLEGQGLAQLLPTEANSIELRVPGGNPVPSTAGFAGDDTLGSNEGVPTLDIKFDRAKLIGSIQAGIAAGAIQPNSTVTITLVAGGGTVLGTDEIRIKH